MVSADSLVEHRALSRDDLDRWAREVESWPVGSHLWGHYAELTSHGARICRTENVSACHRGVASAVDDALRTLATERAGRPMRAFKDKLNYKHPGGAGFRPHQDQLAYPDARDVLSILVAIDDCTIENGCLWIAAGVDRVLETDARGVVDPAVSAGLEWQPIELAAGDALVIDGLAPHWSDTNRSDRHRRVLVASYSPSEHRYERAAYYAARAAVMSSRTRADGRFRVSTLADFAGTEVAPEHVATRHCTHD